jgi:hydroxyacyl-ACP dehydratase HTD2-like protein with hotdog domain
MDSITITMNLQDWIGRTEAVDDVAAATPFAALAATLDWPMPAGGYSALTFNGHRIHYDRQYATGVEGYPGLVALIATLLMDLLRRNAPAANVPEFEFKAVRPTFDTHPFPVHGEPSADNKTVQLWGCDHEGWLTIDAIASVA